MKKKILVVLAAIIAAITLFGIITMQVLMALVLIACIAVFSFLLGYAGYTVSVLRDHLLEPDDRIRLIIAALIILVSILISPLLLMGVIILLLVWFRLPGRTKK